MNVTSSPPPTILIFIPEPFKSATQMKLLRLKHKGFYGFSRFALD